MRKLLILLAWAAAVALTLFSLFPGLPHAIITWSP